MEKESCRVLRKPELQRADPRPQLCLRIHHQHTIKSLRSSWHIRDGRRRPGRRHIRRKIDPVQIVQVILELDTVGGVGNRAVWRNTPQALGQSELGNSHFDWERGCAVLTSGNMPPQPQKLHIRRLA